MGKDRLLITGGAGFIGVNTARHFLDKGWAVTIFDNCSRKGTDINIRNIRREHPNNLRIVRGDVVSKRHLSSEIAKADAVIHLAAQVAVTKSIIDPKEDFAINAVGTFNVLEAIRESANRPPVLYSSTNKVYGSLAHLKVKAIGTRYQFTDPEIQKYGISEREQLDFHSPYGCSKGAADQFVIDYARIYGLKTVVFRQSCIYGEHQFGVEDQGWIAWFTIASMLGRPITIYGNGKQVRDVLYVGDLIQLYDIALQRVGEISGAVYNVGGGPRNTLSVLECLSHLKTEFAGRISPVFSATRAGDQPIFVADVRKAKTLGWEPKTDFASGFKRMREWMESNKKAISVL